MKRREAGQTGVRRGVVYPLGVKLLFDVALEPHRPHAFGVTRTGPERHPVENVLDDDVVDDIVAVTGGVRRCLPMSEGSRGGPGRLTGEEDACREGECSFRHPPIRPGIERGV